MIWYYKEVFGAAGSITDPDAKDRNSIRCAIVDEHVIPMIDNITVQLRFICCRTQKECRYSSYKVLTPSTSHIKRQIFNVYN